MESRSERVWAAALWQGAAILLLSALLGLAVNLLRPKGLPLMESWSQKDQAAASGASDPLAVSLEEAESLFLANGVLFVDARPQKAYRAGHIQGALSLPVEEFDERFGEVMGMIPPEFPLIAYCDGESCQLSRELATALIEKGYVNVRVLFNGWRLWQDANLPTEGP